MLAFAILAVLIILISSMLFLYHVSSKSSTVPGLKPTSKEYGNMADIGNAGSLHEFLMKLHKQFGSIASFWMGHEHVISVASPELFKEHKRVFDKPTNLYRMFEPLISSESIVFTNGTDARSRREHYDKMFTFDAIQGYNEKFQKVTDEIIQKWNLSVNGEHIPLREHMFTASIKATLWVLIGRKFQDENVILDFRKNFDHAWEDMETRISGDNPTPGSTRDKQFKEAVKKIEMIFMECLEDAEKNPGSELLFLDALMAHSEDRKIVISDLITYIIGSFHTTESHLTWCFYFLATHKEVQDKLYREIKSVIGDEDTVTNRNLNDLKYLKHVIDETFRCAVITPWSARCHDVDSQLGGYKIPKNTPVIHAFGVCSQNEKYWPQPKKFDPERFNEDNLRRIPTLAFTPFGFAGKRMCPAYRYTYAELSVIIAGLINKFEVTIVDGQVVKPVFGIITKPAEEVWITVRKRYN